MQTVTLHADTDLDRLRLAIDGDINRGEVIRAEGSVAMSLIDPVLSIECEGVDFSAIHPDILALIGVLAFHPALPEDEFELQTNFPVSPNVEAALRRPWIMPNIRVSGNGLADAYQPKRETVLSYGGGIDSLAASLLFPEAPLVHESPLNGYTDIVNEIIEGGDSHIVFDNLRQLFTTWGLPLWVSVYIASLIFEPRYILSGSEMSGTYLMGGREYQPRHKNRWYDVFSAVGVSILPTSFLSEIGNARIVSHNELMDEAAYCQKIGNARCNSCTKCLRRQMIRAALGEPFEMEGLDRFAQSERNVAFLQTRPLYYGDIFTHAAASMERETWVHEHLADLLEQHGRLEFHEAWNPETFDHFNYPDEFREQAMAGMREAGLRPFTPAEREAFTNYQQI